MSLVLIEAEEGYTSAAFVAQSYVNLIVQICNAYDKEIERVKREHGAEHEDVNFYKELRDSLLMMVRSADCLTLGARQIKCVEPQYQQWILIVGDFSGIEMSALHYGRVKELASS